MMKVEMEVIFITLGFGVDLCSLTRCRAMRALNLSGKSMPFEGEG
jgi:hypothetical protein